MATRTTITISDATHRALKQRAAERGVSFKTAVNEALEAGLAEPISPRPYKMKGVRSMGKELVSIEHTMRLASELEDIEIVRKMDMGK